MAYFSGLPMPPLGGLPPNFPGVGRIFFVDPANGSDGNKGDGPGPSKALATLYKAHSLCTAGKNDVVVLIGDGSTAATARLSLANAVAVDSSATTGVLTWSKNATHLIGVTAPAMFAARARIAPPTGTYTQATFNSGNFLVVSGSGCYFSNFSLFHGFSTGGTNQICVTVSGSRNFFHNVHMGGMGDAASAQNTGSRSLKVTGGENQFDHCVIGLDTVTRTVANASLEFASGAPRNVFEGCIFPIMTSSADVLGIIVSAAAGIDRYQYFRNCDFVNAVDSTSTAMTALATLAASAGGGLYFKDCGLLGIGEFGTDATSLGQILVMGASGTAATTGIAIQPS